jgi:hypothetical protein
MVLLGKHTHRKPIGFCPIIHPYHTRSDTPLVLTQSPQTLSKLLESDQKSHVISSHYRKEWFEKELLPNTPKNSVIVLDNATFQNEKMPYWRYNNKDILWSSSLPIVPI